MGLENLLTQESASPITPEDRLAHTSKMIERAFGRPASDLGEVVLVDGNAVLSFEYANKKHTLGWKRQASGAIFWYLDDSTKPIVLGQQDRALGRLQAALGS